MQFLITSNSEGRFQLIHFLIDTSHVVIFLFSSFWYTCRVISLWLNWDFPNEKCCWVSCVYFSAEHFFDTSFELLSCVLCFLCIECCEFFSYSGYKPFIRSVQFSLVSQSCLTLCDPVNGSTPGFPIHHQLMELTQTHVHWVGDAIQPSHPLLSPSHPAFNLSQHQGLFKWVSSSHQVAKVLAFQLQHQSFQWIFRTDFLYDRLVGSPCSPRDSQESSPTPEFKSIKSLSDIDL